MRVAVATGTMQLIPLLAPCTIPDPAGAEKVAGAVCRFVVSLQGDHGYWREEKAVLEGLEASVGGFPPLCVQLTIMPTLMGSLASSPLVARAAGAALFAYLRECRKPETRVEALTKLFRDYSRGGNYGRRLLFAELCAVSLVYFSRQFFRILFADAVLEVRCLPWGLGGVVH